MNILIEPRTETFDRIPPHSLNAEMALLGCLILGPSAGIVAEVNQLVTAEMFFQPDHQEIFKIIERLISGGKEPSAMMVVESLRSAGMLDECGGVPYIVQIAGSVPHTIEAPAYASVVRESWLLRQGIAAAGDLLKRCHGAVRDENQAVDILVDHQNRVARVVQGSHAAESKTIVEVMEEAAGDLEKGATGSAIIQLGFEALDKYTGGIRLGEYWAIGARPSMGKSCLLRQICIKAAMSGIPTALISAEEDNKKVGRNLFAWQCMIENHRFRHPEQLSAENWKAIAAAKERLKSIPLFVNDQAWTEDKISMAMASLVAKHGVVLMGIDYLQLVDAGGKGDFERATNSSKFIKRLIRELGVAGICTAQLSRPEKGIVLRPTLTDFRSTGQIEQDVDVAFGLHREDYYHANDAAWTKTDCAELINLKFRDGVRGETVTLKTNFTFQCFEDFSAPVAASQEYSTIF